MYAIELVRAMAQRRCEGCDHRYTVYTRGPWFDGETASAPGWRVQQVSAASRPGRLYWEQRRLPRSLRREAVEVLHSTHHTLPLVGVAARRVVTIHDLTFLRIPERYPLVRRIYMQATTRLSARLADAIIVPSGAVRRDVVERLGVPEDRVHVVYEAAAQRFRPVEPGVARAVAEKYGIDPPYILSVGSLEPGKNRARLIRALARLRNEGVTHHLVIVGQRAWRYDDDFDLVEELGMGRRVSFAGYVPDDDLPGLYSGATVVALPSLYEGFGLPVLEAMACGVPVLTSNVSATAEVAGDAALLVHPQSVDQIAAALRRLLSDEALRAQLSAAGRERAAQFSWARAAEETHRVYERVLEQAQANR
jgi:glycosyltransferase involved in cell wall biosynthesis